MTKKNIMIRGVDTDLWNWFAGHVKQKGKTIGETIEKFILKLKKGGK